MKNLIYVAILVVLVAGGWFLNRRYSPGMPVEAAAARRGPVREFIEEQGKTRVPKTYLVTMPAAGRIDAIELAEGDPVYKGQVVARMTQQDLDLDWDAAVAAIDRIDASIVENDDTSVERTSLAQAQSFVESMDHTVSAAQARVRSGEAKRDFAEKRLARIRALRDSNTSTQEDVDQAEMQHVENNVDYQQDVLVHASLAAMKAATDLMPTSVQQYIDRKKLSRAVLDKEKIQAQVKLREAERDRQRGEMRSPIDGVVLSRLESNERQLAAGTVLLEIGKLDDLEVEADVLSQDAGRIELGASVEVHGPAIGPRPARGTVARIYPAGFTKVSSLGVEQQRVKVIVRFQPDDFNRLRRERNLGLSYRVNVKIFTAARDRALAVPRSALFRGADGDWQVFAVRDGLARLTPVHVGLLNDELAEITKGLAENDTVVLAPETDLADGAKVSPILRNGH